MKMQREWGRLEIYIQRIQKDQMTITPGDFNADRRRTLSETQ